MPIVDDASTAIDAVAALDAFTQALCTAQAADADCPESRLESLVDVGEAYARLGLVDQAALALGHAATATAESTLGRLAFIARRIEHHDLAIYALQRWIALYPGTLVARWFLANALADAGRLTESLRALEVAESPGPVPDLLLRARIAAACGDSDAAVGMYREFNSREAPEHARKFVLVAMRSGSMDTASLLTLHRDVFDHTPPAARSRAAFHNSQEPDRRLRVGYVTGDLRRRHPVALLLQPLMDHWDREGTERFVYDTHEGLDPTNARARGTVDRWIEAASLDDAALAHRIEADGIDVLVDLSGHTEFNRLGVFARRAAPVQVTFLGYPGTTAAPNMDWILTDRTVAPPGCAREFTERIMHLPHTVFCFAPGDAFPSPAFPDSDATRPLTFGSFNNTAKLNDRTLDLWARVLNALPDARMLLKSPPFVDRGTIDLFSGKWAARGIDPDRIEFRPGSTLEDMMAEYADVDVALDPMPYNGGITTLQAMWMGVPVICLEGERFSSRMSASFMRAVGLDDWVGRDEDDLVAIAMRASADRKGLLALRRRMRDLQWASPGWNPRVQARALDDALREAWRDWCAERHGDASRRTAC
jgi:protein O-GlcNAc transferase